MASRSVASATISFGLVSIPVRLYSATQPSAGLSFNLLHSKDNARLRQQYVCAKDGEIVPREETVRGYEFAKDQYVTFTPEELKAIEEVSSQAIEIAEFVPIEKIDPIYFDRPYYLGPDRGGAKAYRLLAEALRRAGKAALARYAARGKQYLVLLRTSGGRLVMQQLLHADEVRSFDEVDVHEAELREPEVQLALKLVEQISSDHFHPEDYPDEVRARTLALVEQKVQGKEIHPVSAEAPRGQIIDLVEALKASLDATSGRQSHRSDSARGEAHARRGPGTPPPSAPAGEGEVGRPETTRRPPRRAPRTSDRARAGAKK